ncbi:hypothetical protein B7R22_13170 [Subtercola boreus]|uniref:Uncharacterized protein n=1 Tax=Subtercola boreus TaxID=120213 RepID=A0A3E0VV87_9MICO|nr:hypothetical protein B7R22_13170 [Subtercola boreus]
MVKESDSRRRHILSTLCGLGVRVRVYRATGLKNAVARERCLRAIACDSVSNAYRWIVLEGDDSIEKLDRLILGRALAHTSGSRVGYRHDVASSEPILWIPDSGCGRLSVRARRRMEHANQADDRRRDRPVRLNAKLGAPTVRKATEHTFLR